MTVKDIVEFGYHGPPTPIPQSVYLARLADVQASAIGVARYHLSQFKERPQDLDKAKAALDKAASRSTELGREFIMSYGYTVEQAEYLEY